MVSLQINRSGMSGRVLDALMGVIMELESDDAMKTKRLRKTAFALIGRVASTLTLPEALSTELVAVLAFVDDWVTKIAAKSRIWLFELVHAITLQAESSGKREWFELLSAQIYSLFVKIIPKDSSDAPIFWRIFQLANQWLSLKGFASHRHSVLNVVRILESRKPSFPYEEKEQKSQTSSSHFKSFRLSEPLFDMNADDAKKFMETQRHFQKLKKLEACLRPEGKDLFYEADQAFLRASQARNVYEMGLGPSCIDSDFEDENGNFPSFFLEFQESKFDNKRVFVWDLDGTMLHLADLVNGDAKFQVISPRIELILCRILSVPRTLEGVCAISFSTFPTLFSISLISNMFFL